MPIARPPAPANSSTLRIEKPPDSCFQAFKVLQLAFPNRQHLPTLLHERPHVPPIAPLVFFQLWKPEIQPRLRQARERTVPMPMPKAAVNEDDLAEPSENEVRATRQ